MKAVLFLKMLRDFGKNWGAYLASVFIISMGIVMFSGMQSVVTNLEAARVGFYDECGFADVFSSLEKMPASEIPRLSSMSGVEAAAGRLVFDVRVSTPSSDKNVYLRLISENTTGARVNGYTVMEGERPGADGGGMLLGQGFFEAYGLELGDSVGVIIGGREVFIPVYGTAQGAEYVYAIGGGQSLMPDYETFDVAYLPYKLMERLFDMDGMVNDVSFILGGGQSLRALRPQLEDALGPYGLSSLIERKDQPSNSMLMQEIDGVTSMATNVPVMFLIIASLIMYILVRRVIENQRVQIGTMKAFGYSGAQIMLHYGFYGLVLGLAGGLVGGVLGNLSSGALTALYRQYFSLPGLEGSGSPVYILYSLMLAMPFGLLACLLAARDILRLRPVEAMTPPAPKTAGRILIERVGFIWGMFTSAGKMALRNMSRSKGRSVFTCVGVMFAFSISGLMFSFGGLMDRIMLDYLVDVQRYNMKLNVKGFVSALELDAELSRDRDVLIEESVLELPVKIISGSKSRDTVLIGLPKDSRLFCLQDSAKNRVSLPGSGAVITQVLANRLGVKKGDTVALLCEALEKDENARTPVFISDVIEQNLGDNIYMPRSYFSELYRAGDIANAALIRLKDGGSSAEFSKRYIREDGVMALDDVAGIREGYRKMLEPYSSMILLMVSIGILTGFAIIYNSTVVSLSERSRELASMRVLGFSVGETMEVLAVEQCVITLAGALLGVPLLNVMMQALSASYQMDMFSIPADVPAYCYGLAFGASAVMVLLAMAAVYRKLKKLDMVEVLKTRE